MKGWYPTAAVRYLATCVACLSGVGDLVVSDLVAPSRGHVLPIPESIEHCIAYHACTAAISWWRSRAW